MTLKKGKWPEPAVGSLWKCKLAEGALTPRVFIRRLPWEDYTLKQIVKKTFKQSKRKFYIDSFLLEEGENLLIVEKFVSYTKGLQMKTLPIVNARVIVREQIGDIIWHSPQEWDRRFERVGND